MFALAALAMTNTSCQDEMENGSSNANEVAVTFDLQLENAVGSRLAGDGTKATQLQYWVYKAETDTIGDELEKLRGTATFENLNATVTLTLVKGQTYNFLFWAQSEDGNSYYAVDPETGVVTVDYKTKADANNENRDAFFKVRKELKVTGPVTETIVLKRPFAQINVGTSIGSLADALKAEVNITKSNFTVYNAATRLNTYSGSATASETVNYSLANIIESNKADKEGDLKNVDGKDYEHLAMNYILVADYTDNITTDKYGVGENKQLVNTEFKIYDDKDASINEFEVPNVPVQRNWRTNIIGDILNESVTFNVVIDPKFDKDENYVTHEELAYAAKNGGVVTLTKDVELKESLTVTANMVVNLNGHDITVTSNDEEVGKGDAFIVTQGKLTINGEGTVKAFTRPVWARGNGGAEIIINGGTYIGSQQGGSSEVIYASGNGKVTINGGSFEALSKCLQMPQQDYTVLNLHNNGKDGCAIIVKGGTFKNFDPANNKSENPVQSFVAEGYKSVKVGDNYVVVPNEVSAEVASSTELATAISEGKSHIILAAGVYNLDIYNVSARETLNIIGTEGTKVAFKRLQAGIDDIQNFSISNCEILRMPDKTWGMLVFSSSGKTDGVYTIENCTFNGQASQGIYINETASGTTYNILNCTFNGDFGSEGAVTIQAGETLAVSRNAAFTVNVIGCTFNNIPATSHKIAVLFKDTAWTLNTDIPTSDVWWRDL